MADKPADVFEEGDAPKETQSIHRIRANSTIMQLSKILGESVQGILKPGFRRGRGAQSTELETQSYLRL